MTTIKKYTLKMFVEQHGLPSGYLEAEQEYYQKCYKERAEYNRQKIKDFLERTKERRAEYHKKYYLKRKKAKQEKPFNTL